MWNVLGVFSAYACYDLGEFQGKRASSAGGRGRTCWERAWPGEGVTCGRVLMAAGGVYRVGPYWEGGACGGKDAYRLMEEKWQRFGAHGMQHLSFLSRARILCR